MNNSGGDGVRVAQPLFPVDGQGSIPMSPLQLRVVSIPRKQFKRLNEQWHSRLPVCNNCFEGVCFAAEYNNIIFAVAWWTKPIAQNRLKYGKYIYELRRMAISHDAPVNTASRFLKVMVILLKREMPNIYKLISYQDTGVHKGTIYKASGWGSVNKSKGHTWTRKTRKRNKDQSMSDKIRWELCLN